MDLFDRVDFHPLSIAVLAQQLQTRTQDDISARLHAILHAELTALLAALDGDDPRALLALFAQAQGLELPDDGTLPAGLPPDLADQLRADPDFQTQIAAARARLAALPATSAANQWPAISTTPTSRSVGRADEGGPTTQQLSCALRRDSFLSPIYARFLPDLFLLRRSSGPYRVARSQLGVPACVPGPWLARRLPLHWPSSTPPRRPPNRCAHAGGQVGGMPLTGPLLLELPQQIGYARVPEPDDPQHHRRYLWSPCPSNCPRSWPRSAWKSRAGSASPGPS